MAQSWANRTNHGKLEGHTCIPQRRRKVYPKGIPYITYCSVQECMRDVPCFLWRWCPALHISWVDRTSQVNYHVYNGIYPGRLWCQHLDPSAWMGRIVHSTWLLTGSGPGTSSRVQVQVHLLNWWREHAFGNAGTADERLRLGYVAIFWQPARGAKIRARGVVFSMTLSLWCVLWVCVFLLLLCDAGVHVGKVVSNWLWMWCESCMCKLNFLFDCAECTWGNIFMRVAPNHFQRWLKNTSTLRILCCKL